MTIHDSVPASLQGLKPFPSEGLSEKSTAPGKYFIGAPKTNHKRPLVEATGSDIATMTWFKTPVRFTFKITEENHSLTISTARVFINI